MGGYKCLNKNGYSYTSPQVFGNQQKNQPILQDLAGRGFKEHLKFTFSRKI
jgi:hypothetical protein